MCIFAFTTTVDLSILVGEARQGSAAAQKCLFDRLSGPMLVFCVRYVKDRQIAEDILLDGFCKFFQELPGFTYQGEAALYGWIRQVLLNKCLMHLRSHKAFLITAESEAGEVPWEEDALDRLSAAEVFRLVLRLPEGYRTVFNLYHIEGHSHREIAALLGISEGTSKSQLSKARSVLQKMILQIGTDYVRQRSK